MLELIIMIITIIIIVIRKEPVRVGMPTQFSRVNNRTNLRYERVSTVHITSKVIIHSFIVITQLTVSEISSIARIISAAGRFEQM